MITRATAFTTSDNKVFPSLEEAQLHELKLIFGSAAMGSSLNEKQQSDAVENAAIAALNHKDKILDVLTTTSTSKVRARKVNGGTRKRTPKTGHETQTATPPPPAA